MGSLDRLAGICAAVLAALAAGCTALGPRTIRRDRYDYVQALRESWKEQMLLNIVGLRYSELPLFVEVTSVINQYRIEAGLDGVSSTGDDSLIGRLAASDQPTITYVPLSGEKFTRELLTPVPPSAIVALLQSGWPASLVFRLSVRSINGLDAAATGQENPDFLRLVAHIQNVQDADGIGMNVVKQEDGQSVLLFFPTGGSPDVLDDLRAIRELLRLPPDVHTFRLVYGQVSSAPDEIAVVTRSAIETLISLATRVEVPESDVAEGRTGPTNVPVDVEGLSPYLIRIQSAPGTPDDAFVSVRFRDRWFWIDDRDRASKRAFSFAMLMMSLTAGSTGGAGPVVTVSAGA